MHGEDFCPASEKNSRALSMVGENCRKQLKRRMIPWKASLLLPDTQS